MTVNLAEFTGGTPFNANLYDPLGSFTVLETGTYSVVVVSTELKKSAKNPDNTFVEIKLDVTEGPDKGKSIFERLNVGHGDAETKNMAFRRLAGMVLVAGIPNGIISSTAELHGRKFKIDVSKHVRQDKKAADGSDLYTNNIDIYRTLAGLTAAEVTAAPGAAAAAPLGTTSARALAARPSRTAPSAPIAPTPPTRAAPPTRAVPPTRAARPLPDGWTQADADAYPEEYAAVMKEVDAENQTTTLPDGDGIPDWAKDH